MAAVKPEWAVKNTGDSQPAGEINAVVEAVRTNADQLDTALAGARPYKSYVALLSQSGTAAPTAVVLENTLGGTVVWTRQNVGEYIATLLGAFTLNKTVCFTGQAVPGTQYQGYRIGAGQLELDQRDFTDAAIDSMFGTYIEVRVYL